jgi:hypothetical protein
MAGVVGLRLLHDWTLVYVWVREVESAVLIMRLVVHFAIEVVEGVKEREQPGRD